MKTQPFKLLAALAGLLFFSANLLFAQPHQGQRGHHPPHIFQALEHMKTELQLTETQQGQLEALQATFKTEMEAIHEQDFDAPEGRREAAHELMISYKEKVDEILTDEQEAILEAKKAEHQERRKEHRESRKELHQQLKAYHDEQIDPVLRQQRAKLEEQISAEDKSTIAQLRVTFEQHRQEMQQLREDPEHSREDFLALRKTHEEGRNQLKALVDKYEEDIDGLMAEIQGQREQWHKEMKAIHEQYAPEKAGPPHKGKGQKDGGERHHRHGKKGPGHHPHARDMGKGRFLLLDPNAAPAQESPAAVVDKLRVFPNPAANSTTLEYTLLNESRVRIELRDKEGNLVKNLEEGMKTAGQHQLQVDTGQLPEGIYYLTIVSQGQQATQKMVVSKQ